MQPKEILLQTFAFKAASRLPVAVISGGVWRTHYAGRNLQKLLDDPQDMAWVLTETNEVIQSDLLCVASGYQNYLVGALGGKIKFRPVGAPDVQEPLFKNRLDIIRSDPGVLAKDKGVQTIWEAGKIVQEQAGDRYLAAVHGWGPFTLAGQVYGVEKLMQHIYRDKEAVHAVLEFTTEAVYRYFEPLVKAGLAASVSEPTASGDLISRRHFAEFALPYITRLVKRLQDAGAPTILHICGDIGDRLDLIPATGVKCLSLDYKTDLGKAKAAIGSKLCLAGNVNPVAVLENGTPEDVAKEALQCVAKAAAGGGFVLMPGCDLPPGAPLENLLALGRVAHNYKS